MVAPVFCTYCGQKFSRNEHLERHVITHTNVKPFKCGVCHSSFNRQDLFKRHVRLLHREGVEHEIGLTCRTPIACTACAKAKTRCDREVPCFRCKRKGIECEPRTSTRSRDPSHMKARAISEPDTTATSPPPSNQWQHMTTFDSMPPSLASSYTSELEYMATPPPDACAVPQFSMDPNSYNACTYPFLTRSSVTSTPQSHTYSSFSQPDLATDASVDAFVIPWAETVSTPESMDYDHVDVEPLDYFDDSLSVPGTSSMSSFSTPAPDMTGYIMPDPMMPMASYWGYSDSMMR